MTCDSGSCARQSCDSMEQHTCEHDSHHMDASDFRCSICYELLLDPVVGSCGHDFCKRCIDAWQDVSLQAGRPVHCPVCRTDLAPALYGGFGVCIRLRETIARLFPEELRQRQLEAEQQAQQQHQQRLLQFQQHQQAFVTAGSVGQPPPGASMQASFNVFAETYRQLSQQLLSLVATTARSIAPPPAAAVTASAGSAPLHPASQTQTQAWQRHAMLQHSLALLMQPPSAAAPTSSSTMTTSSVTSSSTSSSDSREAGPAAEGVGQQAAATSAQGRVQLSDQTVDALLSIQPMDMDMEPGSEHAAAAFAYDAEPATPTAAPAAAAAMADTHSAQIQVQHAAAALAAAASGAAGAAAQQQELEQWAANMLMMNSQATASMTSSWAAPLSVRSERDLIAAHTTLQKRLEACERVMHMCGVPTEEPLASPTAATAAAAAGGAFSAPQAPYAQQQQQHGHANHAAGMQHFYHPQLHHPQQQLHVGRLAEVQPGSPSFTTSDSSTPVVFMNSSTSTAPGGAASYPLGSNVDQLLHVQRQQVQAQLWRAHMHHQAQVQAAQQQGQVYAAAVAAATGAAAGGVQGGQGALFWQHPQWLAAQQQHQQQQVLGVPEVHAGPAHGGMTW